MKSLLPFLAVFSFSIQLFAQGTILSISTLPASPTDQDDVQIIVELQFSNSGCELDYQNHSVINNSIGASAHHCMGFLTTICGVTDTFQIGQLPAGSYTFDMTLSSGFGESGCSPGIVPDDSDQFQFSVSQTVGIEEFLLDESLFFPNPVGEQLNFSEPLTEPAVLLNVTGQIIRSIPVGARFVDVSCLESGVYILNVSGKKLRVLKN